MEKTGQWCFMNSLAVVCMIDNPVHSKFRYTNYEVFKHKLGDVPLFTAEVVHGYDDCITDWHDPYVKQFRVESLIWRQRNMYNILIDRIATKFKYVAWLDADIVFSDPNWYQHIVESLEQYKLVQVFSHMQYLNQLYQPINDWRPGYIFQLKEFGSIPGGISFRPKEFIPSKQDACPGFGWAIRTDTWRKINGLVDWTVLGSADFYLVAALFGNLKEILVAKGYSPGHIAKTSQWEQKVKLEIHPESVGYIPGLITHLWHGDVVNRQYSTYQDILVMHQFDPNKDIYKTNQGFYELRDPSGLLGEDIKNYFISRRES